MVIDGIVLFLIYLFFFYPKWKKKELVWHSLLYFYLMALFALTLSPLITSITSLFSHHYQPMMIVPFRDIIAGYQYADWQIILNILLFVPFGFLLPYVREWRGMKVVLYSFLLSFVIEIFQPLISIYRKSDITDIICNLIGGIIGYVLFKLIHKLKNGQ